MSFRAFLLSLFVVLLDCGAPEPAFTPRPMGRVVGGQFVPVFSVSFANNDPGIVQDLHGLRLARSSGATVQTGTNTVITTGIYTDTARAGRSNTTDAVGLLIEEARTNLATYSRDLTQSPWTAGSGSVSRSMVSGPDGSNNTSQAALSAVAQGAGAVSSGFAVDGPKTASMWVRSVSGAGYSQASLLESTNQALATNYIALSTDWVRHSLSSGRTPWGTATQLALLTNDVTAYGGVDVGSVSNLYDLVQLETGLFPTSAIITIGTSATRAGEHLYYPSGSALIQSGRLDLLVSIRPLGATNEYLAPMRLWTIDSNNYAELAPISGILTVKVGGVSNTTTSGLQWQRNDTLDVYVGAGGSKPTEVFWRLNGSGMRGAAVSGGALGAISAGSALDILCDGTSSQLSGWVTDIAFYRDLEAPAWVQQGRPLLTYDFTTQSGGAATMPAGLTFSRASSGYSVQTGTSTLLTSGGFTSNNVGRIGRNRDDLPFGLLLEPQRVNAFPYSRDLNNSALAASSGLTFTSGQTGPDGTANAARVAVTTNGYSRYFSVGTITGPRAMSLWVAAGPGSGVFESGHYASTTDGSFSSGVAGSAWVRLTPAIKTYSNEAVYLFPQLGLDTSTIGGLAAGARDALLDAVQLETGSYATEFIPTNGVNVQRVGERLALTDNTQVITNGQLRMAVRFRAKAAPAHADSAERVWTLDSNNYAEVSTSNVLTVKIGGVANTAPIAWNDQDQIDLYIAAGGSSNTVVAYRINDAYVVTPTVTGAALGNVPTGTLDIGCNGATQQLAGWLYTLNFYRAGVQPSWVDAPIASRQAVPTTIGTVETFENTSGSALPADWNVVSNGSASIGSAPPPSPDTAQHGRFLQLQNSSNSVANLRVRVSPLTQADIQVSFDLNYTTGITLPGYVFRISSQAANQLPALDLRIDSSGIIRALTGSDFSPFETVDSGAWVHFNAVLHSTGTWDLSYVQNNGTRHDHLGLAYPTGSVITGLDTLNIKGQTGNTAVVQVDNLLFTDATITATSNLRGAVRNLLDGDISTGWTSGLRADRIQVRLSAPATVQQFRWVDNLGLPIAIRDEPAPGSYSYECSMDGVNWTTLATVSSFLGGRHSDVLPTPCTAKYFAMQLNSPQGIQNLAMTELLLRSATQTTSDPPQPPGPLSTYVITDVIPSQVVYPLNAYPTVSVTVRNYTTTTAPFYVVLYAGQGGTTPVAVWTSGTHTLAQNQTFTETYSAPQATAEYGYYVRAITYMNSTPLAAPSQPYATGDAVYEVTNDWVKIARLNIDVSDERLPPNYPLAEITGYNIPYLRKLSMNAMEMSEQLVDFGLQYTSASSWPSPYANAPNSVIVNNLRGLSTVINWTASAHSNGFHVIAYNETGAISPTVEAGLPVADVIYGDLNYPVGDLALYSVLQFFPPGGPDYLTAFPVGSPITSPDLHYFHSAGMDSRTAELATQFASMAVNYGFDGVFMDSFPWNAEPSAWGYTSTGSHRSAQTPDQIASSFVSAVNTATDAATGRSGSFKMFTNALVPRGVSPWHDDPGYNVATWQANSARYTNTLPLIGVHFLEQHDRISSFTELDTQATERYPQTVEQCARAMRDIREANINGSAPVMVMPLEYITLHQNDTNRYDAHLLYSGMYANGVLLSSLRSTAQRRVVDYFGVAEDPNVATEQVYNEFAGRYGQYLFDANIHRVASGDVTVTPPGGANIWWADVASKRTYGDGSVDVYVHLLNRPNDNPSCVSSPFNRLDPTTWDCRHYYSAPEASWGETIYGWQENNTYPNVPSIGFTNIPVSIKIPAGKTLTALWYAQPGWPLGDPTASDPVALSSSVSGGYVNFTVPSLTIWTMIVAHFQ